MSGFTYTSGTLNIALSAVGSYTAAKSMNKGKGVGNSGGLLCSNSAPPAGTNYDRGWAVGPNGLRYIQKSAITSTDLVMRTGRAFTKDGRAYVSTAAATGVIVKYIDKIPYTANGEIKATEV